MRYEDYTPDAICRAMNLPGFIEEGWRQSDAVTMRVLFMPAFHPELCVTVKHDAQAVIISVVAFLESFWQSKASVYPPCQRAEIKIAQETFDELVRLFRIAHANFPSKEGHISIDGMPTEICVVSRMGVERIQDNCWDKPTTTFLIRLLDVAWNNCDRTVVRNALAMAASYLGAKYPRIDLPEEKPVTQLAILGTSEARKDYFEMLRRAKEDKKQ